ncbi:hypothetical protein TNCV_2637361 [Trichonephila clavipes]|nr:hypothetical protein TNCV_2637361 [Trichonephila clavipes]
MPPPLFLCLPRPWRPLLSLAMPLDDSIDYDEDYCTVGDLDDSKSNSTDANKGDNVEDRKDDDVGDNKSDNVGDYKGDTKK